jgi:hypothetical protein
MTPSSRSSDGVSIARLDRKLAAILIPSLRMEAIAGHVSHVPEAIGEPRAQSIHREFI